VIIALVALFESNKKYKFNFYKRILFLLIPLLVFLAIFVSIFLGNHANNGDVVLGVQGRYFIPILFPLLLAFHGLIPSRFNLFKNRIALILLIIVLVIALVSTENTLIERYYG
jgi:uncharacterized membrane protein